MAWKSHWKRGPLDIGQSDVLDDVGQRFTWIYQPHSNGSIRWRSYVQGHGSCWFIASTCPWSKTQIMEFPSIMGGPDIKKGQQSFLTRTAVYSTLHSRNTVLLINE